MKRIVTFLLVLVSLVGIIRFSPVSAKSTKSKEWRWKDNKDLCAYEAFDYCTDNKYVVVVKNAEKYSGLRWEKSEKKTWDTKTPYIEYTYYSLDNITVQLQLVNAKTGKPVKASKVKWYGYGETYDRFNRYYAIYQDFYGNKTKHKYDASEEEFQEITLDGEYSPSKVVFKSGGTKDWGDPIFALYKNKLYTVYLAEDWEKRNEQRKAAEEQKKIDNEPFKYAPRANPEDHWYLVPKGYALEDYTVYEHYIFNKDGNYKETKTILDDAVYIYSGQKIEWVIKNSDTGEEISVAEAKKGAFKTSPLAGEPNLPEALSIKKDGKTVKNKKIGSADYLVSVLKVYYDGLVYTTRVIMLPTKADADWCIAHNDYLVDFDLYYYCQYKGISTKAWDTEHAVSFYALDGLEWEDIERLESGTIEPETIESETVTNTPVEEEDECELADDYREIDLTKNREITLIPTASGYQIVSYDISEKEAWYQEHYLGNDKWDEYGSWLEHLAEIRGISKPSPTEGSENGVSIGS